MRTTVVSYLDEFISRGGEIAFAHRRGLRVARWSGRTNKQQRRLINSRASWKHVVSGKEIAFCCGPKTVRSGSQASLVVCCAG